MSRPWTAWWDFFGIDAVMVQTNHPKDDNYFVKKFTADDKGIAEAEQYIIEIESGRISLMDELKKVKGK